MTHHPAPTERQEGLAPVDPTVFLQHEVERLRAGNAELLKANAFLQARIRDLEAKVK